MKPNRNRARDLGFYVLLLVIMVAVIFTMTRDSGGSEVDNYSDLVDLFKNDKVQSFKTEGNTIILRVRTDDAENPTEEMTYDLYSFSLFYEDFGEMIWDQYESGVIEEYDYTTTPRVLSRVTTYEMTAHSNEIGFAVNGSPLQSNRNWVRVGFNYTF